jgi:hypothetical protein
MLHIFKQHSANQMESFGMSRLTIVALAVALVSGCASYPRYVAVKGFVGGGILTSWKEKGPVDPILADDGRKWTKGWGTVGLDDCIIRRRNKERFSDVFSYDPDHPIESYKEDVDCAVWDATDKRAHRRGPF